MSATWLGIIMVIQAFVFMFLGRSIGYSQGFEEGKGAGVEEYKKEHGIEESEQGGKENE